MLTPLILIGSHQQSHQVGGDGGRGCPCKGDAEQTDRTNTWQGSGSDLFMDKRGSHGLDYLTLGGKSRGK